MLMLTIEIAGHNFSYEVECVTRLFFPGAKISFIRDPEVWYQSSIWAFISKEPGGLLIHAGANYNGSSDGETVRCHDADMPEHERERILCALLFEVLSRLTGKRPPWGILTGIRPVLRASNMLVKGMPEDEVVRAFEGDYLTSSEKARLAVCVAGIQKKILADNRQNAVSLYVGIPFCPTRCLYCSFVSHSIEKAGRLIPEYIRLLCEELRVTGRVLRECGFYLQTVYIGGGTPTCLTPPQLGQVLSSICDNFDISRLFEYTVEAGRPDTITPEALDVMKRHGVDRVSINPQTMDDEVLSRIGRTHTSRQTREAFSMARQAGFKCINMDLILGLPDEPPEGFLHGLDEVISLNPENITVHTLTVKRSSALRGTDGAFDDADYDLGALLAVAVERIQWAGYSPYYLYRQKDTRQNLENIGFCKSGFEGRYNTYIMEESQTIFAVGAGGVTKLCLPSGRIERIFNFKYPYEYITRHDQIISRKDEIIRRLCYERDL